MNSDYTWPPYPEPPHIAHMRASIEAVRALCKERVSTLASLADDGVSARTVLAMLPDEDES